MNNEVKDINSDDGVLCVVMVGQTQLIGYSFYDEDTNELNLERPLVFNEVGTQNQQTGQIENLRPLFRKVFATLDVPDTISISEPNITYVLNKDKSKDKLLIQAYEKFLEVCDAESAGIVLPNSNTVSNITKLPKLPH